LAFERGLAIYDTHRVPVGLMSILVDEGPAMGGAMRKKVA